MRIFVRAVAAAVATSVVVTVLVGGWGWTRTVAGSRQPPAARAVLALTRDDPGAAAAVPADYASVMGYRPVLAAGGARAAGGRAAGRPELIRADGGCSSPWGDTRYGFGTACRQHDLGYDLLRYSAVEHRPLGPWARRALDAHFRDAVLARCPGAAGPAGWSGAARCRAVAAVYVAAVRFNSWRQGYGVPVVESVPVLLVPGVAGVLAGALAGLVAGSARARRRVARLGRAVVARPGLRRRAGRLLFSAVVLALCLQPAAVPRPLWVQAAVGGLVAAHAYLLATLLAVPVRRVAAPVSARLGRLRLPPAMLLVGTVVVLAGSTVASALAQLRLDGTVGAPARSPGSLLLGTPAAVLVAVAAIALLLGSGRAFRAALVAARRLRRGMRRRLATVALVPALVLGAGGAAAAAPAGSAAAAVVPGVVGAKGRQFLAGSGVGAAGVRPVRVYVGRDQAGSATARADLAVRELRRAGGFDRSVVLIAVPTGSGWVNPEAVAALERRTHGDVATVAVQYAASPSWVSYLRGGEGVQRTVRATAGAVRAEVARRPAGKRPTVLVYGESLGAWGGLKAYPHPGALLQQVDGALWVGVPPGSGVRAGATTSPRVLSVVHRDDPVPAWTPLLLFHPDPAWRHTWLPLVSFWRETADVIAADSTPVGHGHRYGPELAGAWRTLTAPGRSGPGAN